MPKKPTVEPLGEALDEATTERVVDSMVMRGDISALTSEERTRFYVHMCESLGLNPASQPFALLRLNGKEILYPTRGATDQLAAIHRLTREIVDGPRLIDLNGTKLVYALCRATHPNGRTETAVATVPFQDPMNVLMRCETKAKRRATLSMLGLGMLDESELETIPATAKGEATPIHVPPAVRGVADLPAPGATSAAPAAVEGAAPQPPAEGSPAATAAPEDATPPVVAAVSSFNQAVAEIELPGEAVGLWIKFRPELATLGREEREVAWKLICKRTEEVGGMKNAKVWLKKAIAVEDARRGKPENDMAPNGGSAAQPAGSDAAPAAPPAATPAPTSPPDVRAPATPAATAPLAASAPEPDVEREAIREEPSAATPAATPKPALALPEDPYEREVVINGLAWQFHLLRDHDVFAIHGSLAKRAEAFRTHGVYPERRTQAAKHVMQVHGMTDLSLALERLDDPRKFYSAHPDQPKT